MNVDHVPTSRHDPKCLSELVIHEDNEAVIKMTIKGRSPALRHVPRTHRVDLDWLFERIREDPGVFVKYVNTHDQIADMLTKGQFTSEQWQKLVRLAQIVDVNTLRGATPGGLGESKQQDAKAEQAAKPKPKAKTKARRSNKMSLRRRDNETNLS